MGALPTLSAATEDGAGGGFVGPDRFLELVGCSAAATDREVAAALWQASEALTGTTFTLG